MNGFQVLAYATALASGTIGTPPFTDTLGAGSFSYTPPAQSAGTMLRVQFVVRDGNGTVIAATPVSSHSVQ